ncbi:MAG: hypothetical protein C5B52_12605 [Bacteroidetes bacterium]|nr:MAG: hypothetical protein C5B52_12605 [Bacteroidota bacterium]
MISFNLKINVDILNGRCNTKLRILQHYFDYSIQTKSYLHLDFTHKYHPLLIFKSKVNGGTGGNQAYEESV